MRLIFLVLALLALTACGKSDAPTPTPTKTPVLQEAAQAVLPSSTPIPRATPMPESTTIPGAEISLAQVGPTTDRESAERLFRLTTGVWIVREMLLSAAKSASSGELQGLGVPLSLAVVGSLMQSVSDGMETIPGLENESAAIENALAAMKNAAGRWNNGEITSADVEILVGNIDIQPLVETAYNTMIDAGFTKSEVEAILAEMQSRMTAESSTPPAATPPANAGDSTTVVRPPSIADLEKRTINLSGVEITMRGISLMRWADAMAYYPDMQSWATANNGLASAQVFGLMTVAVTNTTTSKINIHPAQGIVVVGSEQVDLSSYMFQSDDVGGELFPGVTKKGNIYFWLLDRTWEEIQNGSTMVYEVGAPRDENFKSLSDQPYHFEMQLIPQPWPLAQR